MITHSVSWALAEGGWITRCGCFADTSERLSEDPSCHECRCWLGLCDQGCTDICLRKAGALIDGPDAPTCPHCGHKGGGRFSDHEEAWRCIRCGELIDGSGGDGDG